MKSRQAEFSPNVFFSLVADAPTNVSSTGGLLNTLLPYLQASISQLVITKRALVDEAIREAFLLDLNTAYLKRLEDAFGNSTSTLPPLRFIQIHDFPYEIKEYFDKLRSAQEDEDLLYEIADAIAEWLMDSPEEYQTALTVYLNNISSTASRILIAALSDAEVKINSKTLLYSISLFLKSKDRHLAQIAATCILTCGGNLGKDILQSMVAAEELPHSKLIQGISRLLS